MPWLPVRPVSAAGPAGRSTSAPRPSPPSAVSSSPDARRDDHRHQRDTPRTNRRPAGIATAAGAHTARTAGVVTFGPAPDRQGTVVPWQRHRTSGRPRRRVHQRPGRPGGAGRHPARGRRRFVDAGVSAGRRRRDRGDVSGDCDRAGRPASPPRRRPRSPTTRSLVRRSGPIAEVAELMMTRYVRHVLVERDGRLVGVVSARDLLALLAGLLPASAPGGGGSEGQEVDPSKVRRSARPRPADDSPELVADDQRPRSGSRVADASFVDVAGLDVDGG